MANALKKGFVMSALKINLLLNELNKEIGNRRFFTIDDLYNLGVFGTKSSARKALKTRQIAYVKISPRRRVIPLTALLEYLQNNLSMS